MVWGYLIIYTALFITSLLVTAFWLLASAETVAALFFMALPFVMGYLVLSFISWFFASFVFLHRNSKLLALNNFKAFGVFTYFYFYNDCLMGYVSAILRIISTVIAGIVMMPRISYSFLGRHLERLDEGYATYSGFLHMEATHTNPILICFCSLLCYRDLSEHVSRFKNEKRQILETEEIDHRMLFNLKKFVGFLPPGLVETKAYNRNILNRWHLALRLAVNRELIVYRGHYIAAKRSGVREGLKQVVGRPSNNDSKSMTEEDNSYVLGLY